MPGEGTDREEWLFETKCGAVVGLSLPGEGADACSAIVYEGRESYVLVIPNHPDLYSLQAIAWNIDFRQFP